MNLIRKCLVASSFVVFCHFGWAASGPIDVNTADVATLQQLKGIGAVRAQSIIDYRTKNGPFKSVDELSKIKGIGSGKTLEALRPQVTVGATAAPKAMPK